MGALVQRARTVGIVFLPPFKEPARFSKSFPPGCTRAGIACHTCGKPSKESPMPRMFALASAILLLAFAPAHAQTRSAQTGSAASASGAPASIATPSDTLSRGAVSSGNQSDPALGLRGPCSVSPNATGGVTTSSSCGSDPLEVPTRTLASPDQTSVVAAPPAQTSAGGSQTSGQGTTGTTTQGGGSRQAATATSSGSGGGGAPSATSTLCSSTMPTTTGPSSPGSLFGSGC
jgi:hypothetical protein